VTADGRFETLEEFLIAINVYPLQHPSNIWARWWRFHEKHPEVYADLRSRARTVLARGWRQYAMRALWEVMRWHFQFVRDPEADWKLNDHFPSRYARLLMAENADLRGFFELRTLRAA
jgi:hypothetical protein